LFSILNIFTFKILNTVVLVASVAAAGLTIASDDQDMSGLVVNSIPYSTRVKYMRLVCPTSQNPMHPIPNPIQTNQALYDQSGPCPFALFGAIIVNHTADEIVCKGANFRSGDPP
jgi:hypothetical protein